MNEVWRALDVSPSICLDYMRSAIADTMAPFDLRITDEDFGGEIRSADIGMIRVVSWANAFDEGEIVRTTRLIRKSDPELCKIDVQLRGRLAFEQGERQTVLGPGDFAFADLSRPCRLAGSGRGGAAVLFPRALLPLPRGGTKELSGATSRCATCTNCSRPKANRWPAGCGPAGSNGAARICWIPRSWTGW
jgi:hypothetical protein